MIKKVGIVILIFFLFSCGGNLGSRINKGNLSVFFYPSVNKDKAIDFTHYWVNNGFVGERKQVIQLLKDSTTVYVKLIEREAYHKKRVSINEQALLQQLEYDLRDSVFHTETEILITDNKFRPLIKE